MSLAPSVDDKALRRRGLTLSVADGVFYAVMVGVSESYLGAFAVELGFGATELGLLASVPLFVGAVSQLAAPWLARRVGTRKRLVVLGAMVQALSHLGLIAVANLRGSTFPLLLAIKVAFWVSGMIIAPAWSAWMATLTRGRARERYFAWRSGAVQASLLVAFVSAGAVLGHAAAGTELDVFAALFGVALVARCTSAVILGLQPDPRPDTASLGRKLALRDAVTQSRWRFAVYLAGMMFGAHLSVPYFTPYMLLDLELSYPTFAALTSVSILTKAVFFPLCHHIVARFGLSRLLFACGLGVALVPALWTLGRDVPSLLLAHVVSGVAWAGVEYASFQLLIDSSRDEHRLEFMAIANAVVGAAQVAGSLVGARLLLDFSLSYWEVFVVSSVMRALPLVVLLPSRGQLEPRRVRRLFARIVGVRPGAGAQQRPLFSRDEALEEDSPNEDGFPDDVCGHGSGRLPTAADGNPTSDSSPPPSHSGR